jgi:hypothetical protein
MALEAAMSHPNWRPTGRAAGTYGTASGDAAWILLAASTARFDTINREPWFISKQPDGGVGRET